MPYVPTNRERYEALCAEPSPPAPLATRRPPDILGRVAEVFAVERRALTGRGRSAPVAAARQAAMLVLRERYGLSLAVIGALLGNRDHSTVAHGVAAADTRRRHDAAYAAQVAAITEGGPQ